MSNMEFNKAFAALLVAGIVGLSSGIVAKKIVHSEDLAQDAVTIDVPEVAASGRIIEATADPILALLSDIDPAKGQKFSKACSACHSFDKNGPSGVGPNLWDIVNAKKAHSSNFAYSDVFKLANQNNESWSYQELNKFLWKPKKSMPGTKMAFIGIKKPEQRAAVIAWLRTLSDNPAALPTEQEILAELPKEDGVTESETNIKESVVNEAKESISKLHPLENDVSEKEVIKDALSQENNIDNNTEDNTGAPGDGNDQTSDTEDTGANTDAENTTSDEQQ